MGNQKQKWTQDEEDALLKGVSKHGPGKWKNILKDPDFAPFLVSRSNIDLKDKWRNLSVSTTGQGSRDKSRTFKVKAAIAALPTTPGSAPAATSHAATPNTPSDTGADDPSNSALDGKNAPRYNAMIFEALSSIKDVNGSDISAIVSFIEQRHEVTPNFRRLLSSRLRRLVSQGKLEKVQNCYKIKKDNLGTKAPSPKPKEVRPRQSQNSGSISSETLEEAAIAAAYKVAEAENKSFLAAEAVKEVEKVAKMAEDADSMQQIVKEICERCSHGQIAIFT